MAAFRVEADVHLNHVQWTRRSPCCWSKRQLRVLAGSRTDGGALDVSSWQRHAGCYVCENQCRVACCGCCGQSQPPCQCIQKIMSIAVATGKEGLPALDLSCVLWFDGPNQPSGLQAEAVILLGIFYLWGRPDVAGCHSSKLPASKTRTMTMCSTTKTLRMM
jgi:hypothetical protein